MCADFRIGWKSPIILHIIKIHPGGYLARGTNNRSKIGPNDYTWIPRCNLSIDPLWKEGTKLAVKAKCTSCCQNLENYTFTSYLSKIYKSDFIEIVPVVKFITKALPPPGIEVKQVHLEQDLTGKSGYLLDHKAITMMCIRNLNSELEYLKTITIPHKDTLFIPQEKVPELMNLGSYIRQRYPEFDISQITYIRL